LENEYLKNHSAAGEIDYYLCGPPLMIKATKEMLEKQNVPPDCISFDEF
jgi:Na+-transporting NADH:ubiquinone oxidoreductase subunit F